MTTYLERKKVVCDCGHRHATQSMSDKCEQKRSTSKVRRRTAIKMREEGKTFSQIGTALGGVSSSRARDIYLRGMRMKARENKL